MSFKGKQHTEETKRKISNTKTGTKYGHFTEEHSKNLSLALKGREISDEWRAKISASKSGMHLSASHKRNISIGGMGLRRSEKTRKNISSALREYRRHPKEEHIRHMLSISKGMNGLERKVSYILRNVCPGRFRYNGDFRLGVMLDGLVPDFVNINGKKQVIDVYAPYWKERDGGSVKGYKINRTKRLKRIGWSILYIGDNELENKARLAEKISAFAS
jgi:very-short-patch-repair endonuclease